MVIGVGWDKYISVKICFLSCTNLPSFYSVYRHSRKDKTASWMDGAHICLGVSYANK